MDVSSVTEMLFHQKTSQEDELAMIALGCYDEAVVSVLLGILRRLRVKTSDQSSAGYKCADLLF